MFYLYSVIVLTSPVSSPTPEAILFCMCERENVHLVHSVVLKPAEDDSIQYVGLGQNREARCGTVCHKIVVRLVFSPSCTVSLAFIIDFMVPLTDPIT